MPPFFYARPALLPRSVEWRYACATIIRVCDACHAATPFFRLLAALFIGFRRLMPSLYTLHDAAAFIIDCAPMPSRC